VTEPALAARRIEFSGQVQGVGFRPFVYRLALAHGIGGWVQNRLGRVVIEAQGETGKLDDFMRALITDSPPLARPELVCNQTIERPASIGFDIRPSDAGAPARIFVPTDQFACADCLAELADPGDRRYRYPFNNCCNCGPRYTLITSMPYDRQNTTMAGFPLCADCQEEYENPADRRFHAEPVACPQCGPTLCFRDHDGRERTGNQAALTTARELLRAGQTLAVKGIGGYHLMCDARSEAAVARLRAAKHRPKKPLAVMFPPRGADGLDAIRAAVQLEPAAAESLRSPLRPIVLVRRREAAELAQGIAPGLAELGVFLPYSPLHQLLLDDFGGPLVATSGNLSGEPVLTDEKEADQRLAQIADGFLHHDRPIQRPADDSVLRPIAGRLRPLRLGRGAAPLELELKQPVPEPLMALGGQMKGAIALAWDRRVVISPHIGEMDRPRSLSVLVRVFRDLPALYGVTPTRLVVDAHPGYSTHRWARAQSLAVTPVFHHVAHAAAVAGEHEFSEDLIVFTWDGTGYGTDGSLWGGETLHGRPGAWQRVASMRPFRLPGGEKAGRQPWRSAAALYWELGLDCPVVPDDAKLAHTAWQREINCPESSAVGRLFDAAAALLLNLAEVSHEAEGPMQLEAMAQAGGDAVQLPMRSQDGLLRADWAPLLEQLRNTNRSAAALSGDFHASLAGNIVDQACTLRDSLGTSTVALSGGVFQNRLLTETARDGLRAAGFDVLLQRRLPCNDGGLCFGQVVEAAAGAQGISS